MTNRAVLPSKVWAKLGGVLFLFGVLTAASAELFLRGRLAFAAGLIAVLCHVAATLLLYQIFRLVSPSLAMLAVSFNFAGAALVLSFLLLLVMIFWLVRVLIIMAHKETAVRAKLSSPPDVETRQT
jgi:Na+-transporting methylmalonyl-CoA/oxaloacetate decarboxylase gamma subunit